MKKIAAALLLSTAIAAPAFAADNGFYTGVTLGRSNTGSTVPGVVMTKSKDTVWGVLGGYQFTRNWGAEAFYTDAGRFAGTSAGVPNSGKTDAYGIDAVGTMPLADDFSLYGKLGYARAKTSASSAPAGLTGAKRGATTYGLGGMYNATRAVGIRLGWDRYGAAVNNAGVNSDFNSNVYSLGGIFKF